MKQFISLILILLIIGGGLYYIVDNGLFKNIENTKEQVKNLELPETKPNQPKKEVLPLLKGELFDWMGKDIKQLEKEFGKPKHKWKTPYGYTWWVYTDGVKDYIQFGIADKRVQTFFATGENISIEPFQIGDSYESISEEFPIKEKLTYHEGLAFYTFQLSKEDQKLNPLFKMDDNVFIQCYMDGMTNQLSSIRVLTGEVMLQQRFYEMEYRGTLPDVPELNDKEWAKVTKGMEKQIFDLTNVYRNRFGLSTLKLDEEVKEVAYLHSKDMYEHNYFSHYSEDGKGLKERLAEKEVYYLSAGENIAAQYTDGPAAMEGWLNSESHREALLMEDYTHLGVGVYHRYYTQNFLLKP